jgi:uncharacterized protein (TIGR02596 family)
MNHHPFRHQQSDKGGFTLVELLTVIAVIAILLAVIASVTGSKGSRVLTKEGQSIGDQIALARQIAMSMNRDIELRFYQYPETASPADAKWAIQLWKIDTEKGEVNPIGRRIVIAEEVVIINDDLAYSPIFSGLPSGRDPDPAKGGWYALKFRPNGRLAASLDNTTNYLTLRLRRDAGKSEFNYYTLQINRLTGMLSSYRP